MVVIAVVVVIVVVVLEVEVEDTDPLSLRPARNIYEGFSSVKDTKFQRQRKVTKF